MTPAIRSTVLACVFFTGFGCLVPFLPVWLQQVHGFSGSEIGLVLAIGGFSRVFAGPLAAAWADGRTDRRAPMFVFSFVLLAGFAALRFAAAFWAVFTLILLLDVAFWGLLPVVEAALLRLTRFGWPRYGLARGLASAAFVVGSTVVGALVDRFGPWSIWAYLFGVAAALIAATWWMHPEPVTGHREAPFADRLSAGLGMLRDRRFTLLILAAGLIQATHSFFYVSGTLIWTSVQHLSATTAGNLWSVGVVTEVVFLIVAARWTERFRPETLIVAGGVCAIIRWSALATLPPVWALVGLQLLHGGTFAATFLGAMRMIHAMHGDERTATAQMIYMGLASAPAQALATLASGPLYDRFGAAGYLAMTAIAVVGVGLAIVLWLGRNSPAARRPPRAADHAAGAGIGAGIGL
ncbi:MAG: MFS transporter [Janthinobacterium lividum]